MGVLVLPEADIGAGDADVGDQMELMPHVPGVAVDHDDAGLRQWPEGVNVDASRKALAMAE
jgi:hypothetical protein